MNHLILPRPFPRLASLTVALALNAGLAWGQSAGEASDSPADKPLPDVPTLMRQVEAKQRLAEAVEKDYIYREASRVDEVDGHGGVKKTVTREFDVYWQEGVNVRKLVKKDGKELSADEQKKEQEHIDKDVAKGRERRGKADAAGRETDSGGRDELTVSRMLELGAFTNERREQVNGRDTIVVDFVGDPKAKTHTPLEAAVHELTGTAWIDEEDKSLIRSDGQFAHPFKIGGGLLVNVKEGTSFTFRMRKINGEVWLPDSLDAQGKARFMLFASFDGKVQSRFGDYRKFKATSTILPGVNEVDESKPEAGEGPPR